MPGPVKLSATIVTFNEERRLEPCLRSLQGVADEIVVVDARSTDGTRALCERYGVRLVEQEPLGDVARRNRAVDLATHDHVLALDADERLSDALRAAVLAAKADWGDCDGYAFDRANRYCGELLRHAWSSDRELRLWDRRRGRWGGTEPHGQVELPRDRVARLRGDLVREAYSTVDEHLRQTQRLAEVAARARYAQGERPSLVGNVLVGPTWTFVKRYLLRRGFLDGYYGFVFSAVAASLDFYASLRLHEYRRRGLPEEQLARAAGG